MQSTSDLSFNPKNPRRITPERLTLLERSLSKFGDLSGITFNRRSGRLVTGHQRISAWHKDFAKSIRYDCRMEQPTKLGTVAIGRVLVDGEEFSYREVEWSDDIEQAANIAANKSAGEFDMALLGEAMLELRDSDADLDLTMFDVGEREKLFSAEKFEEISEPDSKLDEKEKITCPSCGEQFAR